MILEHASKQLRAPVAYVARAASALLWRMSGDSQTQRCMGFQAACVKGQRASSTVYPKVAVPWVVARTSSLALMSAGAHTAYSIRAKYASCIPLGILGHLNPFDWGDVS